MKKFLWNIFKKVEERKKNWEKENEDYKKLIDKNLEGSKIEKILSGILGFHKREDMIYWQDLFLPVAPKRPLKFMLKSAVNLLFLKLQTPKQMPFRKS